jgi:hypothetical protein
MGIRCVEVMAAVLGSETERQWVGCRNGSRTGAAGPGGKMHRSFWGEALVNFVEGVVVRSGRGVVWGLVGAALVSGVLAEEGEDNRCGPDAVRNAQMLALDEAWPVFVDLFGTRGEKVRGVAYFEAGKLKAADIMEKRQDGRRNMRLWVLAGEDSFVAEVRDFLYEETEGAQRVREVLGMRYVVCCGRLSRVEPIQGAGEPTNRESVEELRRMYEDVGRAAAGSWELFSYFFGVRKGTGGGRTGEGAPSERAGGTRAICTTEKAERAIVRYSCLRDYWGFMRARQATPLPARFVLAGDRFLAKVEGLFVVQDEEGREKPVKREFFGVCTESEEFAWPFEEPQRGSLSSDFSWGGDPESREFARAVRETVALNEAVYGIFRGVQDDNTRIAVESDTVSLPDGCPLSRAPDGKEKAQVLEWLMESLKDDLERKLEVEGGIPRELTVYVANFDVDYLFTYAYIPEMSRIAKLLGPRLCYLDPGPFCARVALATWSGDGLGWREDEDMGFVEESDAPDPGYFETVKERLLLEILTGNAIERRLVLSRKEAGEVSSEAANGR